MEVFGVVVILAWVTDDVLRVLLEILGIKTTSIVIGNPEPSMFYA